MIRKWKTTFLLLVLATALVFVSGCGTTIKTEGITAYTLVDTVMGRPMEFALFPAPLQVQGDPAEMPVLFFLHGMGGDHLSLDNFGIARQFHEAMTAGRIPPFHIVMPNGEQGYYANWYDGSNPYEEHFIKDIVPTAEQLLGVSPGRENRHIAGVSMGGQGALRIGLKYPELFGSITAISTLVFNREEAADLLDNPLLRAFTNLDDVYGDGKDDTYSDTVDPYRLSADHPHKDQTRIFMAVGSDETKMFLETTGRFVKHLESQQIPHSFVTFNGGHGWAYWKGFIVDAVAWSMATDEEDVEEGEEVDEEGGDEE